MKSFRAMGLAVALLAVFAPAAAARDRDHDGLPDRWEQRHHLSTHRASGSADSDRDHVDNLNEYREHTNPRDRDSDNDRVPDGREDADHDGLSNAAEDATGNDPLDRDSDNDGIVDGRERAGVIKAFDGSRLTIRLSTGGAVSGIVDDATELSCESESQAEHAWSHGTHRARRVAASSEDGDLSGDDTSGDDTSGDDTDPSDASDDSGTGEDNPGEDQGDDVGDDSSGGGETHRGAAHRSPGCSLNRLKRGVRVHEAKLSPGPNGTRFVQLELLR